MSDYIESTPTSFRKRTNTPLIIGLVLVLGIIILAIWGPVWAPNDPREQVFVIQIDGEWITPPYKAFTPGYLLGSDNLGRDLFSWLLWSIRPTMILILIVAALRMAIGVVLGVIAGYSDRLPGKVADALIAVALSVPALIASIMIITAVGFHLGVWAFVLGLVATGWAETASLVRERTRTIRAQQAVEASVALGASGGQTFFLHILPQVMPMVWMLMAFEVSNTLVTMAGLGYLGIYLGGAVFQEVDDFVYQRISEMPELGQMLATAWMVLDEPWAMVAAGTVVFFIVLAFNLIGEGLQNRLTRKLGGSRSFYLTMAGNILPWWDERVRVPVGKLVRRRAFQAGAVFIVVAALALVLLIRPPATDPLAESPTSTPMVINTPDADTDSDVDAGIANAFSNPGGHYWANEHSDPWHTRMVDYTGPTTNTIQWEFETPLGFAGGPVVDKDGVLYLSARDVDDAEQDTGLLYALSPEGLELWQAALPAKPVGGPALTRDGSLLVCDRQGVSAISSDGSALWRYDFDTGKPPTAGPVIAPDNDIYIKARDGMWALSGDGALLWHTPLSETAKILTPHLNPDSSLLFWEDLAFDTTNGDLVSLDPEDTDGKPATLSQYIVGADGELYHRFGEVIYKLASTPEEDILLFDGSIHTWDSADAGVMPDGQTWLLARPTGGGMGLGFYWSQPGSTEEVIGKLSVPQARNIKVLAVDTDQTAYVCMDSYTSNSSCVAIAPEGVKARMRFNFRGVEALVGSALAPGRMYVATYDGTLMAIGDDADVIAQSASPQSDDIVQTLSVWDSPVYPGGHPWSHEKGDPWGTRWAAVDGPQEAQMLWVMENGSGYASAPVVAADGTVYANATDGRLMAYNANGSFKWAVRLKVAGVGSPAIGPDGTIYITDQSGYLTAFDTEGNQLWKYHASGEVVQPYYSEASGELLREEVYLLDAAGPAGGGPMVAPNGTIYFTLAVKIRTYTGGVIIQREVLLGVTPTGESVYADPPFTWSGRQILRLSPNDAWLIVHNHFLTPRYEVAPEGVLINELWDMNEAFYDNEENHDVDMYYKVGADGEFYRVYRRTLEHLTLTDQGIQAEVMYQWDEETSPGTLVDAGVTQDGYQWMFFRNGSIAWITPGGNLIGPARFPLESMLFGLDQQNVAYGCGSSMGRAPDCMAYSPETEEPLWTITLQESEKIAGGALAPGVVYVTTEQGRLYALGLP